MFNGFVVDRQTCQMSRAGRELPVERRVLDLLIYLVEHRERVVSKQELLEQVWQVRALSDGVLSNTVAKLRRVLDQGPRDDHPIETVRGRGYRFRASVTESLARQEPTPTTAARREPFVGRDELMHMLRGRLPPSARGSENLVVLAGEAGIGKTRAARELAAIARELGVQVWTGAAHDGDGAPPYWPWMQIVRAAHEQLGARGFQDALPAGAWAIAQLLPELAAQRAAGTSREPQVWRFALFEESTRLLRKASAARPLLIVIDDLQCTDPDTLELLRAVVGAVQEAPLLFVATLRTGEAPGLLRPESPLQRLSRVASVVRMPELDAEAVAELLTALTGSSNAPLARALHQRTRGNPLFVRQSLDLMLQRGDSSLSQAFAASGELPPAIQHIIRRRLGGLTDATRHAIAAGAVAGMHFDTAALTEALGIELEPLLDALEPALHIGVIEARSNINGAFAFAHELVRDSLYDDLGLRERGALHGRLARALARRHGQDPRHLATIAHHRLHALPFDLEAAMRACRDAAAAAREVGSFESAAHILTLALETFERHAGDPQTRFWLLFELGEDQFYAGWIVSAWRSLKAAAQCASHAGRGDLLAESAPRLADCLELGVGETAFTRWVVEQALASDGHSGAMQARLIAQQAELAIELPAEQRAQLLDHAASLADRGGTPGAVLEVAHTRAILRNPAQLTENAAAAEHFLELLDRHPDAAAGMRYRSFRSFGAHLTRYLCALTTCDVVAADAILETCHEIAQSCHIRAGQLVVLLLRAGRALGDGRLSDLRHVLASLEPLVSAELPLVDAVLRGYHLALLDAQPASSCDDDALKAALAEPMETTLFSAYGAIERARRLATQGDMARAQVALARVPRFMLERMPARHGDLGALCSLVEICLAHGDHAAAAALYHKLRPHAALNAVGPVFEYRGAVAQFLGLLARALGEENQARVHFEQAVVLNRRLGMAGWNGGIAR